MAATNETKNKPRGPKRQQPTVVKGKGKTFVRNQWVGTDKEPDAPKKRGRPRKNPEAPTTTTTKATGTKPSRKQNIAALAADSTSRPTVKGMSPLDINKLKNLPVNSRQMAVIDAGKVDPKALALAVKKKKAIVVDVDPSVQNIPVFAVADKGGYSLGASRVAVATSYDNYLFGDADYEKVGDIKHSSGQIVIGDPENLFDDDFRPHEKASGGLFDEACRIALNNEDHYGSFAEGSGFTFSTLYGEGNCPVYAKGKGAGKVDSVSVVFEEDPFDMDDVDDEFSGMYDSMSDMDDIYDDF